MKTNDLRNETIIYECKVHWMYYLKPAILALLFLTGGFSLLAEKEVGGFFLSLIIAFISVGIPYLNVKTTQLILTEKRLHGKQGIIRIKKFDIPVNKIQYVNVDKTIFGRIFGYSTININAITGQNNFKMCKNGEEMQNSIMNTIK